jgi:hypothetical protein
MQLGNMHKYAEICGNMHNICTNMPVYARPQISSVLRKYERNMQDICTYMQNMQARILYAVHAHIYTPHFADGTLQPQLRI